MKTEMRKRSLWERIKLAFRYLFSNDALLPVYQEGSKMVNRPSMTITGW
jgi:hypothetical protein